MVDTPTFESPIVKSYPKGSGGLELEDLSSLTKLLVRAADDTAAAQQLAVSFGASRTSGETLICGQRPTEWLVLGAGEAPSTLVDGLDKSGHMSVIDHTHARCLFRLSGQRAASLLEKVCSLDWSDAMTPNGAVVSASLAKTNCDIVRNDLDGPSYLIACDRSFGQYLFDAVLDAGEEFDIGAVTT